MSGKKCETVNGERVEPGWGCCRCRGYNGLQRTACRECGHVRCDVAQVVILPYVDPPLPPSAPAWARTYCSSARVGLSLEDYERGRRLFSKPIAAKWHDIAERYPAGALLHLACLNAECACDGHYVRVACVGLPMSRKAEKQGAILFICDHDRCDIEPSDHPVLPVPGEGITVIGYYNGLTPALIVALREGRSFEECRAMAAPPEQLQ